MAKKGTFTKNDLEGKTQIRKEFHGEHIWIKISEITDEGVKGTIDREPVFETTPNFGAEVFVKWEEIEDVR